MSPPQKKIRSKSLYAVSLSTSTYGKDIVILVDAYSIAHAKNIAEAKYYEKGTRVELIENRTKVWKISRDESTRCNPSRR